MKKIISFFFIIAAACNNPGHKPEPGKATMPMQVKKDSATASLKNLSFDSKKDLVCGMPVSVGVEDTVHYKRKLYGFCSKECKEEFLKDPHQYLSAK